MRQSGFLTILRRPATRPMARNMDPRGNHVRALTYMAVRKEAKHTMHSAQYGMTRSEPRSSGFGHRLTPAAVPQLDVALLTADAFTTATSAMSAAASNSSRVEQ